MAPIVYLLSKILSLYPDIIEKYYSNVLNEFFRKAVSKFWGLVSFSAAEIIVIAMFLALVIGIIIMLIKIKTGGAIEQLLNVTMYLSILYILFMVSWGFNYQRLSFDKISGLKIEKESKEQLYKLCDELITKANALRSGLDENSQGVMIEKNGYKDVFRREKEGYANVAVKYKELGGNYGIPKPILLSKYLCYTGITGIYIPYTSEANVNINIQDYMLPCTTAHEMAHQRGFAREDEANYIAYLACINSPYQDFQYSGVMLAAISSMNQLSNVDYKAYEELHDKYSSAVKRDILADNLFWEKYKGNVEKISNNINNSYLKTNGQSDGTRSYGRMVDLLLAEYLKEKY